MKKHIILLLKTLINNNACVEAARTREKKYNIIAPILAVFALFFCALPVCIKGFQVNGQDVVSTSLGADDGLYRFGKDVREDTAGHPNFSLTIGENKGKHILNMDKATWEGNKNLFKCYDTVDVTKQDVPQSILTDLYRYTYVADLPSTTGETTKANWLEIYFTENTGNDFQKFYVSIAENKNPLHTEQAMSVVREDADHTKIKSTNSTRNTSFIVFGKEQFFIAIYNKSTSSVSSLIGDYQNTPVGTNLLDHCKSTNTETLISWKTFFNQCYINNRFNNTWKQTGINLGINAGVIVLMGFVIWVTTRGKNNPFRIYSYWDSQKICFYACFTPGLIGLFGFLSTSIATMIFAMTCGVRVLWLSMRTLKYQAPAK